MLSFHAIYSVHVTSLQPYITKKYFEIDDPPVYLSRIAIGDGTLGSLETFMELPVVSVLETYPQIIGYDTQVFEYFQEQYVEDVFRECLSYQLIFVQEYTLRIQSHPSIPSTGALSNSKFPAPFRFFSNL